MSLKIWEGYHSFKSRQKKKKSEKQEAIIGIKTNNQNVIERSNFIFPHVFMKHDLVKF